MIRQKSSKKTLNYSKDSAKQLPRLNSQKRAQTALQRKQSHQVLTNRPFSDANSNKQMKRTLSTSNACKTVRYQATSALYAKKIEEAEKQNYLLEREIKKVQEDISQMRKSNMNKKRTEQFVNKDEMPAGTQTIQEGNEEEDKKLVYRKNINVNDPKALRNEIRIMENKIKTMRKKIDEQVQKNKSSRQKIDAVRKQIKTLKGLNSTLTVSYEKVKEQFQKTNEMSKKLDEQILEKNNLMNQIRIENAHKKGQIIKQYDHILRKLDEQLTDSNNNNNRTKTNYSKQQTNNFYMTEIEALQQQIKSTNVNNNSKQINRSSLSKSNKRKVSNMGYQIGIVRQNLQNLEGQFKYLQEQTGLKNAEQLTKNFLNKYQQNFKYYKYINSQLLSTLQEVTQQNDKIKQKRQEVMEQLQAKNSDIKFDEICEIQSTLEVVISQKNKIIEANQQYQKYFNQLKNILSPVLLSKLKISEREIIDENNILTILEEILERVNTLRPYDQGLNTIEDQNMYYSHKDVDLDELLQAAKKDNIQQCDRILSREDFLKMKESLMTDNRKNIRSSSKKKFYKK